jgi:hypothetical protein
MYMAAEGLAQQNAWGNHLQQHTHQAASSTAQPNHSATEVAQLAVKSQIWIKECTSHSLNASGKGMIEDSCCRCEGQQQVLAEADHTADLARLFCLLCLYVSKCSFAQDPTASFFEPKRAQGS